MDTVTKRRIPRWPDWYLPAVVLFMLALLLVPAVSGRGLALVLAGVTALVVAVIGTWLHGR